MTLASRRYVDAQPSSNLSAGLAVEAALLTLSIIAAWFLSATFVNSAWGLVALVNYGWMVTLLFRIEPRATVLILGSMTAQASTIVALIFIENGSSIPELGTIGTPGPYSSSFLFYTLVWLSTCVAVFRLVVGPERAPQVSTMGALFDRYATVISLAFLALIGLLMAWLVLRGLMTGFPLLAGTDRFLYRRLIGDKITVYALNLKFIIMFALGMIVYRLPTIAPLKLAAGGAAFCLIIIFFLFGDKFFTQLGALAGFFAPYLYVHHQKVRKYLVWFGLVGVAALSLVFSVTWFIYSNGGTMSNAATMERLSGRIVGQGELWYLQGRIGAPLLSWDAEFVARNLEALKTKDIDLHAVQQSLGPNYFSNRYAPNKIRNSLMRNAGSVTYTSALEPVGLAVFGWVGLVALMMVVGVLMALAQVYIAIAITGRSMISTVFSGYILLQLRKSLTQFSPWVIFSIFSLRWLAIIFAIELGIMALGVTQRRKRYGRFGANRTSVVHAARP